MTIDEVLKMIKDGRIGAIIIKGNKEDDAKFSQDNIEALNTIIEIMFKYQQLQDDYESRLKADMVAILTEIQTEIKEVPKYRMTHNGICVYREAEEYISDVNKVIQQKIEENKE